MGRIRQIDAETVRVVCDCGEYVHEITVDKGTKKLHLETYRMGKKNAATKASAKKSEGKSGTFFDLLAGDDDDGENSDDDGDGAGDEIDGGGG